MPKRIFILFYFILFSDFKINIDSFFHVPGCSGIFWDVPECSGMFHVPDFIDGRKPVLLTEKFFSGRI